MANPFSGLENIGASYLQGMQLAEQRRARQEALAQREEEARIRQQYYQDLVDQRREAARLAAQNKEDTLAAKFGENAVYNADGTIDIVKSAKAQKEAGDQEAYAETAGLAQGFGKPIEGLPETVRSSKAFQRGLAGALVKNIENDIALKRVMASQGIIPAGEAKPLPSAVENLIQGPTQPTIFDILGGIAPQPLGVAPKTSAETAPAIPTPEGYQEVQLPQGKFYTKKPKVEQPKRVDRPHTVYKRDENGDIIATIKMTNEEKQAYDAQQEALSSPPAAGTNTTTLPGFFFDPKTKSWAR